jgi:hypothetical protein
VWLPFLETPSGSSSGGTIAVVKSDLSSNSLQTVASFSTQLPTSLGDSYQVVVNGSNVVTSETPYGIQYLGPDGSGNLQAFQVLLGNTASVPTPNQAGLISGAPFASTTICGRKEAARNTLQPATGFVVFQYAVAPNTCSTGAVTVLINASDSSTTAATSVPVATTSFADLYLSTGQLYGLVVLNPSTNSLNLYRATAGANSTGVPQFTTSTTLVTGVASYDSDTNFVNRNGLLGNSVSFITVNFTGSPAPAAEILRVDTTGAASNVHTAVGTLSTNLAQHTRDNTNYYFIDAVTGSGSTTYNFWAAPIAGGNAVEIGSLNATAGTTYSILDSDGTSLLIQSSGSGTSTIYALAVAGPSNQTPTQIVQSASLAATLDYASGELFVTEVTAGVPSALVFKPSGATPSTAIAGPLSNTELQAGFGVGYLSTGSVLELSGVTATSNAGGAEFQLFSTSSLTPSTAFTCPLCGGGTYTLPTGTDSAFLGAYSPTVAIGEIVLGASGNNVGLVANPQTLELVQLSVTGSNVAPY